MNVRLFLTSALVAVSAGCAIKTNVVNIGQKTSLENQLMGELEPLTEEQALVSSVRGIGGVDAGSQDELLSRAVAGRQRQLFNRDDLDELRSAGCIGESRDSRLVSRSCETAPETLVRRDQLLAEENADRAAIIDWAVGTDPVLTAADRPKVERMYHALLLERLRTGDWYQDETGSWHRK